jgi:hypothetical protein
MTAKLKNILGLAILGVTLLATTVPAWAGRVNPREVFINGNPGQSALASGSLTSARYSADSRQTIGCRSHTLRFSSWTTCFATNSAGKSLACGSGEVKFLEVVHAMTDSSDITFRVDPDGSCRDIRVYQGSDMLR